MTIEPSKKSPTELLAYQTELLERIAATQQQLLEKQYQIAEAQNQWLKSIDDRVNRQSRYLSNINNIVSMFGIVLILSICIGFFSRLLSY